jgi:hypothetical protein
VAVERGFDLLDFFGVLVVFGFALSSRSAS